ncbi:MAG: hypothetical protein ILO42_02655 [Clostridia bacterium]|nr:hypothetical protein [Clostridia bacterium]
MALFLALDSGGTKTIALIHDEQGNIQASDVTPGCNAMDVGAKEASERLVRALERIAAKIPGCVPERGFCGVASKNYYGEALYGKAQRRFAGWNIRWEDDGRGMISSVMGNRDGGCIVCGTGSSMFCRRGSEMMHTGGWGYLMDTVGSGFMLGRDALRASLRMFDGRGEKTLLYELTSEKLGAKPEDSIPAIYSGGRPFIASFASTVFAAVKEGDSVAREIFALNAQALADMTFVGERFYRAPFDLVLSGGILLNYPEYAEEVRRRGSRMANMIRAEIPPVFGCALENVMYREGFDLPAFRERFMKGYGATASSGARK